jgi:uncharacterized SAM-binding protein YcdF (DUF218 family)
VTRRTIVQVARVCAACVTILLLLIFFTPVVRWAAEWLTVDWYEGDGDALVVLGGSMLVPGTGPGATLGYDSYLRTVYAGWILSTYHFPVVVVSGAGGLAEAMAKLLLSQGVPERTILLESWSNSTSENAQYVKRLLQQHSVPLNDSRIVIVTSDYHCRRARAVFAKCGLHVRVMPVPDVIKRSGSIAYRLQGFVTIATELAKGLQYRLTGRI